MLRLACVVCCGLLVSWGAAATAPVGLWYTEDNESIVVITQDEDSGELEGRIVWLAETHYTESEPDASLHGTPKRDLNNPEPALRDGPIIGMRILAGFTSRGERWDGGSIYDPNNGKTYKARMQLDRDGRLVVRGYIGVPALGRSTAWNRVPEEDAERLLQEAEV